MQATHPRFCCVVLPRLKPQSAIFSRLKCELPVVYAHEPLFLPCLSDLPWLFVHPDRPRTSNLFPCSPLPHPIFTAFIMSIVISSSVLVTSVSHVYHPRAWCH
ncbi:hypothetical protein BO85DRAFT_68864 [Aspergillus piperis CBS 112811]|uniref:Uncharacterized protein n=1 Tax=Aspergillus piperis CBS 112811 TaxID=1448313 RepID=A0A8G1QZK8_9EURO|nr:hypothetical protein BO85DRAFT_68864 [Aspergillus piperis CBS 112811]RAH55891.1 hypothetical protein BO85DRAFT_68864 [Aspergillus piperis CBS 112811]